MPSAFLAALIAPLAMPVIAVSTPGPAFMMPSMRPWIRLSPIDVSDSPDRKSTTELKASAIPLPTAVVSSCALSVSQMKPAARPAAIATRAANPTAIAPTPTTTAPMATARAPPMTIATMPIHLPTSRMVDPNGLIAIRAFNTQI